MNKISLSVFGAAALLFSGISVNAQESYQVVRGDTLYGISQRYGVSLQNLMQTNSLHGSLIHPGQRLVIPGVQASSTGYTQDYNQGGTTAYRPYEPYTGSFSSSSSSSSVSTTASQHHNSQTYYEPNTQASQTQYGQQGYIVHTVMHGDTLWSIGQRYGQSVNTIKQLNQLDCNHIQCGQKIYIPAATANNQYPAANCNQANCNLQPRTNVKPQTSYGY